jgi:DNA-binding IclR family transcriptional regulator
MSAALNAYLPLPQPATYTNEAQQRILKLLLAMLGDVAYGYAPGDLSRLLAVSASSVTRDLRNLEEAGLALLDAETGRWRLSPLLPQQALAMLDGIERARARLDEVQQRYTRTR